MTTEDRKAFEEWWVKEKGPGNFGQWFAIAHESWLAATARERERCAALVEAGLGRTNTSIARSLRFPGSVAAQETTTNPAVDHKPENIDHKRYRDSDIAAGRPESVSALGIEADSLVSPGRPSEPPDELVERAKAAWMKYDRRADYGPSLSFFMAAFAAGYAAEWKARADKLNDYVGLCVPTDEMVGAVAGAISHEREACAKVADEHAARSVLLSETTAEDTVLLHGAEAMAAQRIAAAIRARKGGENA